VNHGTRANYNAGCRCPSCRSANASYFWDLRERNRGLEVPEHVHGSINGYVNYCCRCELCKAASRRRRQKAVA